jgi:hypothetical protein
MFESVQRGAGRAGAVAAAAGCAAVITAVVLTGSGATGADARRPHPLACGSGPGHGGDPMSTHTDAGLAPKTAPLPGNLAAAVFAVG